MYPINNIDTIIHTVGYFNTNTDDDYYNSINTNILGTLNLCVEAKNKNIKHLIYISSIFATIDEKSPYRTYF